MDRRSFIKKAGLVAGGAAATTIAAPAIAQSMPEIKWRLTSAFPKVLDTLYDGVTRTAQIVSDLTDGKFQIQPFAGGEIVPLAGIIDAVQNDTVEMGHTATYYYYGKDPTFAFGCSVPFGLNSRGLNAWWYYGGALDLFNTFLGKFNMIGFPAGNTGTQMGGWWRKEIKTVDDLKGIKFRCGGFAGAVLARLGVVPSNIAPSDIYPALEKGTLDATEFVGPYDDLKLGFYKVAKYYYYPGWWEGASSLFTLVNMDKWNSLPKTYQEAIRTASAVVNNEMQAHYDAVNPGALRELVKNGAQLRAFSSDIMSACFDASIEVYKEFSAKNESFKTMYDSMSAFRNEEFLSFQIADGTYDNFMADLQRAGRLQVK